MSLALPGLSRRRHIWGEVWRAGAAALVGAALLAAEIAGKATGYGPPHAWVWIDVSLGVCSLVLLFWRRKFPFAICAILTALSAVSATSAATSAIALISLTTHRRWRPVVICSAEGLVGGWVFQFFFPTPHDGLTEWISSIVIGLLAIALSVAIGTAIGARRLLVANLRTQLEVARESQQLRVEQAKVAERARIAREMHDVLAHRISLVAMHSGALSYRTGLSEEELRESTTIIRDNAHAALTELREVLGVLRDPTAGPRHPDAPQPTLADLPALVSDTEPTDGAVELAMPDNLSGLSELVSRNAYRIAQEGLTNRRKHAAGQPISIRFSRHEDELVVIIRNPMPHFEQSDAATMPESGLGLVGARERAVLVGGELTSGRDRGGATSSCAPGYRGRVTTPDNAPDAPIRVLLVDDDALVRAGLRLILRGAPDIEVLADDPADGAAGVAAAREQRPDVILMDIRMPGTNGIDATKQIAAQPDSPYVIVLTTFDSDDLIVQALRAGASGFLLKDTPPERLVEAVRAVVVGDTILSPSVTRQLVERVTATAAAPGRDAARQRLASLTDRELEVAQLIGRGLSNADIAGQLYMSVPTVKAHVSRVLTKMRADNRVQVAILVHDAGQD